MLWNEHVLQAAAHSRRRWYLFIYCTATPRKVREWLKGPSHGSLEALAKAWSANATPLVENVHPPSHFALGYTGRASIGWSSASTRIPLLQVCRSQSSRLLDPRTTSWGARSMLERLKKHAGLPSARTTSGGSASAEVDTWSSINLFSKLPSNSTPPPFPPFSLSFLSLCSSFSSR